MGETDEDLWRKCIADDADAFGVLFDRHADAVFMPLARTGQPGIGAPRSIPDRVRQTTPSPSSWEDAKSAQSPVFQRWTRTNQFAASAFLGTRLTFEDELHYSRCR
jgi:hypothetical protein